MHLKDRVPIIILDGRLFPVQFVVLVLNVGHVRLRRGEFDLPVETCHLKFQDLVLGLLHHMCVAGARHQIGRAIGDHEVFGRHEHGAWALHDRVEVDLLEGRACKRKLEQKLFEFVAVLGHLLCDEVVHLRLNTLRLFGLLRGQFAHDLGSDRP